MFHFSFRCCCIFTFCLKTHYSSHHCEISFVNVNLFSILNISVCDRLIGYRDTELAYLLSNIRKIEVVFLIINVYRQLCTLNLRLSLTLISYGTASGYQP